MRLLVITQKLDQSDGLFGFFHSWVRELALRAETVTVIALSVGIYDMPSNVSVVSLGKERGLSRLGYLGRLYSYLWRFRNSYDMVFVHMNPIYVVLAGPIWKLAGKKTALWYTHRQVDLKLHIATFFADVIFTAAPESFRVKSSKVKVVGHGIDTDRFQFKKKLDRPTVSIIHVGRITKIKNCDTLIEAAVVLRDSLKKPFTITFIGEPATKADSGYKQELIALISKHQLDGHISFAGSVSNHDLPAYYYKSDISVNLTPTGGIDKVVLESFASGTPVLVSNEAFLPLLGNYAERLAVNYRDPADLAKNIKALAEAGDRGDLSEYFSKKVAAEYSVPVLIDRVYTALQ